MWRSMINYQTAAMALLVSISSASAQTTLETKIVAAALAESGKSSGPSYVVSPWGGTTTWYTDVYGTGSTTDGMRMRAAITRYYNWYWANPATRGTLEQIKATMKTDISGDTYDPTRKQMLVDEIVRVYNLAVSRNNNLRVQPPTTDQATLNFLGIRKQCLEWVNSIALSQGGSARSYNHSTTVSDAANHRAGMMMKIVTPDLTHAAIIVEIKVESGVRRYRLAEANYGSGWMNPIGSIPWNRTVRTDRWVTLGTNDRVIRFE